MAIPQFTIKQLLEAGIHFGHTTRRWNPKMRTYIFGEKNKIHIIDLQKTAPLLRVALQAVHDVAATGGKILFVSTKRQGSKLVKEAAEKAGQYYVNHRWLGGMMTNWKTVSNSISRLKQFEEQLADENSSLVKKEKLKLEREVVKLKSVLGGILDMNGVPDMAVVLDVNRDHIAVAECNKLNIPVVGILDTNSDPAGITFPVPGNDDAIRSIEMYCDLFSAAATAGRQNRSASKGKDLGESAELVEEVVVEEVAEVTKPKEVTKAKPKAEKATMDKEKKEIEPAPAESEVVVETVEVAEEAKS
jgi:small subunit ribosomal protein S2